MKKGLFISVSLIGLVVVTLKMVDFASLGLNILNTALKVTNNHTVTQNVAYGEHDWQTLDIYSLSASKDDHPVVVFFYGGGWNWGKKSYFYFAADAFVKKGYTVVIPDYIKYPKGTFPQFVEDGAKAIAWVKQNIGQYHGDSERIFLVGHSAGAHTAALLATDKRYLSAVGMQQADLAGVAGIAGPYNFTPSKEQYVKTFGEDNFALMKASNHVSGNEPPMLLIHAEGDQTVAKANQESLAESLKSANSKVETILYDEQVSHISILLKLHAWFASDVNVASDIDNYFSNQNQS